MQKFRGLLIIVIMSIAAVLEVFYLIIDPLLNPNTPKLTEAQYWALVIPVFLFTFLISFMFIWIGYTMIVTKEPLRMTYDSAYEEAAGELDWLHDDNEDQEEQNTKSDD
ncbi:MAG: hypothetical protein ACXAD7_21855 [Candidatus Kariarchaeaceae archaeon]|jgi:hypothetical protein